MSTVAARARTYRQRQKHGRAVYAVEASEADLIEALKRSGFLDVLEPSHGDVTAALERVIELWIEDGNENA
jgi:hypothetical protein